MTRMITFGSAEERSVQRATNASRSRSDAQEELLVPVGDRVGLRHDPSTLAEAGPSLVDLGEDRVDGKRLAAESRVHRDLAPGGAT